MCIFTNLRFRTLFKWRLEERLVLRVRFKKLKNTPFTQLQLRLTYLYVLELMCGAMIAMKRRHLFLLLLLKLRKKSPFGTWLSYKVYTMPKNLNLCIKTAPITAGADSTVYIRLFVNIYSISGPETKHTVLYTVAGTYLYVEI